MARNIKIKEKSHAVSNGITVLVLIFAIAVCVIAAGNLYQIYGQYKAGSDEYDRIQNMVVTERAAGTEKKPEIKEVQETGAVALDAPIEIDFESLQEINNDIVGWLYEDAIPSISYPVVQGEDNEYYLHRTFEKADNFAGTVFIDCKNNKDLSSCNTIVYGHNMKNGTMFGKLKQFKEESTIQKSPYIWMLTPEGDYRYEIFTAYTAEVDSDTYTLFKGPGEELVKYAEKMQSYSSLVRTPLTFDVHDRILTLSTCTGDDTTRYVVQAVYQE